MVTRSNNLDTTKELPIYSVDRTASIASPMLRRRSKLDCRAADALRMSNSFVTSTVYIAEAEVVDESCLDELESGRKLREQVIVPRMVPQIDGSRKGVRMDEFIGSGSSRSNCAISR